MLRNYLLLLFLTSFLSLSFSYSAYSHSHADNERSDHRDEDEDDDKDEDEHHGRRHDDDEYSIRAFEALSFGKVVAPAYGTGVITIDPQTEQKTLQGGSYDLGGGSSAAIFEIRASAGSQFEVIVPSSIEMKPRGSGVEIRDITVWPTGILRVDSSRRKEFRIGGGMYLPSGSAPKQYSARISVFVNKIME